MRRLLWTIAAFLLLPASLLAEPTAVRPDNSKGPNEVEVRLVDGSRIHMTILQENLEVVTKYGTLTVPGPVTFARSSSASGLRKLPASALQTPLASSAAFSYKERESASTDLLAIGPAAYLPLQPREKEHGPRSVASGRKLSSNRCGKGFPKSNCGLDRTT